jgi:hypothetical protein
MSVTLIASLCAVPLGLASALALGLARVGAHADHSREEIAREALASGAARPWRPPGERGLTRREVRRGRFRATVAMCSLRMPRRGAHPRRRC